MLKMVYKKCMKVWKYFLPLNVLLLVMYGCQMVIPYAFSGFIDQLTSDYSMAIVKGPMLVIVGATGVLLVVSYLKDVLSQLTILKVSHDFLDEVDRKLEHLPLRETAKHNPAYLNSRIFNDILTTVGFAIENLMVAMMMFASTVVLFYLIGSIHLLMLGIVFLALFINMLGIFVLNKLVYKKAYAYRDQNNVYLTANHDRLASIKETKIHGWYDIAGEQVDSAFNELLKKGISLNKVIGMLNNIGHLTKNITLILTMLVGGTLLIEKQITIGQLVVITTYTNMCLSHSEFFLKLGQGFQHAKVCFARLEEFLDAEEERNGTATLEQIDSIQIKDLSFAYPEKAPLYTGLNLTFEKGKVYCLKGKNGDGKSTLIDLVLGLNDGYTGHICFNDQELSALDMKHIRKEKIATILQQPVVQRLSVKQNMIRGVGHISSQMLDKLCECFRMGKLINSEEATALSGGEKQKIAVIRGLLKESDVIILDEPVSAMDTDGIEQLKKEIKQRKKDKIILLISHHEGLFDSVDEFLELSNVI